ncbi:Hypothetical predicted protein [Mytilus galloprovincialis]|uniref:Endonuclease/exonuclease/phosphatase domain-containing protein n=1 Tax=Mytilus galloprovincialis TaxID=29158 RepID=A0A8B6H421_MYTGA|nr:Hypothetical predicted protein [Mytilus galloprovincialis]
MENFQQFSMYPQCSVSGVNTYVNNTENMNMNSELCYGHVRTVSNDTNNFTHMRKRSLSNQDMHYLSDNDSMNKRLKKSIASPQSNTPPTREVEPPTRLEMLIIQLSTNLNTVSEKLEKRIDELETNFEQKITEKISEKVSIMIDEKLKQNIDTVREEVKSDMLGMQNKIDELEKTVKTKTIGEKSESRNKIVIKNLNFDEREKENEEITKNKVQTLLKDGLTLSDITLKSVCIKEGRGSYPGVVIVEIDNFDNKSKIMKNKRKLRANRAYENVYINNDQPAESRNIQASIRTVLKELAITETFLRKNEKLNIPGFTFFGNNRKTINRNANRGSGGVGVLVKDEIYNSYTFETLDSEVDGILWIKMRSKTDFLSLCIAICYLPPAESGRALDHHVFFQTLLEQVYTYQNMGRIVICGDFNSRVGRNLDYIEGVDNIKPRSVVDFTENHQGDAFINFLSDANFAMLNGRFGDNDFTYISPTGRSVVDYVCVPYEDMECILDFKIMPMSNIINELNVMPDRIPDHSLMYCDILLPKAVSKASYGDRNTTGLKRKFKVSALPNDLNFLTMRR